jgi:Asp-tRNA(Asn)/Glu-tRNA(Gln) amidotransferase A subunit family amidase
MSVARAVNDDLAFLSVAELGALLRRRRATATQLARYFLDRLERLGPTYNAITSVTGERALAEAAQADRESRAGKWRGPLHGIPYGVKDLLATTGDATTWGAEPYRDQVFDADATVVTRLRRAGAVLVAKLAMVELAGGMGYRQANASFTGPGKTPWNPEYWSGGSSSGPGVAVAAGLVPFAIGSETSGSILTPAAYCGVTGLRPTYGRDGAFLDDGQARPHGAHGARLRARARRDRREGSRGPVLGGARLSVSGARRRETPLAHRRAEGGDGRDPG